MEKNNKLQKLNDAQMNTVKGGMYWSDYFGTYVVGEDDPGICWFCADNYQNNIDNAQYYGWSSGVTGLGMVINQFKHWLGH